MTVENSNREISYTGNDSVTVFAYNFLVYSDDHIFIYLDGIEQTVGFTISGVGDDSGGDITFVIAPKDNVIVKIERIVPISQLIEYQQYGPFDAKSNERGLDLGAMVDSQLADLIAANSEKVAKAIRVALTDPTPEVDLVLPDAASRANKFMGFDATGKAVVTVLPTSLDPTTPFIRKDLIQAETGTTTYTLINEAGASHALFWDGREQQPAAYDIVGDQLTVNFEVEDGQTLSVWYEINGLPINTGDRLGSIGNPIIFLTTAAALNASGTLLTGDWFTTLGDGVPYDGRNANYQVVGDENAGDSDGYEVLDLDGKKGRLMFRAPFSSDTPITPEIIVDNKPYDFKYPANDLERQEMLRDVSGSCIGYGGSTWWVRPCVIGRQEGGRDVVYRGDTYGTPEDRDLERGITDVTLWTNKRLGEAITKVTRLEFGDALADLTYSFTAINDKLISYREDEHHQPAVVFNNLNQQLITTYGIRNSARTQDGAEANTEAFIRYGQDINTLSKSTKITHVTTPNYAQMLFAGSTNFIFRREAVSDWSVTRATGGQAYQTPVLFIQGEGAELTDQWYIAISWLDKSKYDNPQGTINSIGHVFGQPHPTNNPDSLLYYAKLEYFPADTGAVEPQKSGGLFVNRISDSALLGGGRIDGNFTAFTKGDMDVAYTPAVNKRTRLLDVQYGDVARAILAEWDADWDLPETMPIGQTYDLIMITYDGVTTTRLVLAAGLRGDLGYNKYGTALNSSGTPNGESGIEGTTYAFGASFYRGEDARDLEPFIYYCDRDGDDINNHRLRKITLDASFATVNSDVAIIENSTTILYRPEMTLGGKKRILFYGAAEGWSSFNSFVAKTKFIDETI